jgi:uncharacterized phage-associated protein
LDDDLIDYLEVVFDRYGGFTAKKLEQITHAEQPWREARGNIPHEARCDAIIRKDTMRDYYKARLQKDA